MTQWSFSLHPTPLNPNLSSDLAALLPSADRSRSLSALRVCGSVSGVTEGSRGLAACGLVAWTRLSVSFSIARARAAMLNSMSSEGRMSFSYVKQKSEDSPKVSVSVSHAEVLFLQTRPSGNYARLCTDNRPCVQFLCRNFCVLLIVFANLSFSVWCHWLTVDQRIDQKLFTCAHTYSFTHKHTCSWSD